MLFDPNEKNNSDNSKLNNSDDDFVGSSFAVSFKPNDPANSVSDKLKNSEDKPNATDSIKDDFDSFEFDPSISAFKPIGAQAAASKAPAKEEPAKKDISPEAAVKKTEPIDFAISEADKKTSPFVNATKPPPAGSPFSSSRPASPARPPPPVAASTTLRPVPSGIPCTSSPSSRMQRSMAVPSPRTSSTGASAFPPTRRPRPYCSGPPWLMRRPWIVV